MDDHEYNIMVRKLSGEYVQAESPWMTEKEFPHSFQHHLCAECGESCFTPCDLLLEYEELEERLDIELMHTSRTIRRMLQQRMSEIEEEIMEDF
jgi:hypothetical protein